MKNCFIVGCQRSGTTWIQRMLQRHQLVCGGEESHFFRLFAPILTDSRKMISRQRKIGPLIYMDDSELVLSLRKLWDAVFRNYLAEHNDALVHVEKTPDHALHLSEIVEIFPDAKIIVVHRDSRAVVSSLVAAGKSFGAHWAPKTYSEAAIRWYVYVNAIEKWRKEYPHVPCLVLHYEECLENPKETMRNCFEFLGLATDEVEIKDILETDVQRRDDPAGFARKRGNEGWKHDLPWYGKLITWRYTRKMMKELGYECRPLG